MIQYVIQSNGTITFYVRDTFYTAVSFNVKDVPSSSLWSATLWTVAANEPEGG